MEHQDNEIVVPKWLVLLLAGTITVSATIATSVPVYLMSAHSSNPKHEGAVSIEAFNEFKHSINRQFESTKTDINRVGGDVREIRNMMIRLSRGDERVDR